MNSSCSLTKCITSTQPRVASVRINWTREKTGGILNTCYCLTGFYKNALLEYPQFMHSLRSTLKILETDYGKKGPSDNQAHWYQLVYFTNRVPAFPSSFSQVRYHAGGVVASHVRILLFLNCTVPVTGFLLTSLCFIWYFSAPLFVNNCFPIACSSHGTVLSSCTADIITYI